MKTYLIDLDGTMYQGTKQIEGAKEFIEYLIKNHHPFYFFTNNSSRTGKECVEHMEKLGFKDLKPEMFYTSAMASCLFVKENFPMRKAYYIGMEGMREALVTNGFEIVEEGADFVFVGLDKKGNYELYSKALREIVNGAILVGTNNDRILLQENGANVGNGSIVALFEYASGKESLKIGKPHAACIDIFCKVHQMRKEDLCIIGDNLETDILCGIQAGVDTIFVTTGIHTVNDIERLHIQPTRVIKNLTELF